MPNPKAGTVVPAEDLPRVIDEAKAGRVEFRLDKTANLHVAVGKVSFEVEKLYENLAALMDAIKKAKALGCKRYLHQTDHPGLHDGPRRQSGRERRPDDERKRIRSIRVRKFLARKTFFK